MHARSTRPDTVPLVLLHGWPSTVADFLPILSALTDPPEGEPAFHVVAPSIPGFAFSGPTRERGWGLRRIAGAVAELMRRLGYDRYVAQGGDFGSMLAPERSRRRAGDPGLELGEPDREPHRGGDRRGIRLGEQVGGAQWLRHHPEHPAADPRLRAQRLAAGPAGVEPGVVRRLDPAAGVQAPVDRDAILTDVTIFWLTGTAGSAARLYKDLGDAFADPGEPSGVPTAGAVFPVDSAMHTLAERSMTVVRWTRYDRGGHFASLQAPDLLVEDVRAFVRDDLDVVIRPG